MKQEYPPFWNGVAYALIGLIWALIIITLAG